MLVAVSRAIKNKPTKEEFTRKKLNGTFDNLDITLDELGAEVTKGHAFSAHHRKKWRNKENFTQAGFVAADIDHGLRITDALRHPFVEEFGGLIYTSPSHTDANHRFRIIFELENPIIDKETMEQAYRGLIRKFGADKSCKDACRMFYGSEGAQLFMIGGAKLPQKEVDALIVRGKESEFTKETIKPTASGPPTVHSRLVIDPDEIVDTADGRRVRLVDLPERTPIHCPVHIDRSPSAFTLRSKQGTPGLHCVACKATFFIRREGPYYDFDYELKVIGRLRLPPTRNTITQSFADRDRAEAYEEEVAKHDLPTAQANIGPVVDAGDQVGVSFIGEQFLPPVQTDADVILVKSPKGSGKTEWLKQVVLDAKSSKQSVLLIGHRQSLIISTANRVKLTPYIRVIKDSKTGESTVYHEEPDSYFAICVDSLPLRLKPHRDKYDIILIDEVEQVIAHLTSDTLRNNRHDALMLLRHYLQKSKKIYAMDADLNRVTGICIPELIGDRKKTAFVVVNDWQTNKGTMNLYEDKAHLVQVLIEHLSTGKRCFVCANSKSRIKRLTRLLEEEFAGTKKLKTITSENSQTQEAQDFLVGLPNTCLDYDCVLVSPAVGTGVDITFPEGASKIDAVFGFFVALVNTHFDIDQQLCRVRHPGAVHVWVSPQRFSFSTDQGVIKADLLRGGDREFRKIGYDDDGHPQYSDTDKLYATVFTEVTALRRASKNNFRENFCTIRKRNGWSIVEVAKDEAAAEQGKELESTARELEQEAHIDRLLATPPISEDHYKKLRRQSERGSVSPDDEAKMRRHEIERFYRRPISRQLVESDRDGAYREEIRTFVLLNASEEQLDDWWIRLQRDAHVHMVTNIDINEGRNRRNLLVSLFSSAGLYDKDQSFNSDVIVTQATLADFIALCREKKVAIERLLDVSLRRDLATKATLQLNGFLRLVGLSVRKCGHRKEGESKIYLYRLASEQLEKIQADVQHRADPASKVEWEALQQQRFPEDREIGPLAERNQGSDDAEIEGAERGEPESTARLDTHVSE